MMLKVFRLIVAIHALKSFIWMYFECTGCWISLLDCWFICQVDRNVISLKFVSNLTSIEDENIFWGLIFFILRLSSIIVNYWKKFKFRYDCFMLLMFEVTSVELIFLLCLALISLMIFWRWRLSFCAVSESY